MGTIDLELLAGLPAVVQRLEARIALLEARGPVSAPAALLTVKDAATALGMSEGAVRAAICRGTIACVHVGRRVRVPASAIPGRASASR